MIGRATIRRYLTPVIALGVIGALVTTLVYLRKYSPYKVSDTLIKNPEIILSLQDVDIMGRSDGKKMWSFHADRVEVSRGRYRTEFFSIKDGKLYDDDKVAASVTAGRAIYDSSTGNVEVADGVKIVSIQGYRAEAESATWSGYFRKLRIPGQVKLSSSESMLTGRNLIADIANENMMLDKPKMVISISEMEKADEGGSAQ